MSIIAAIDPGVKGAIALFDRRDLADVIDMPLARHVGWAHSIPDALVIRSLFDNWGVERVIIETIQPRPGNGMSAVAASAVSWGILLGVCHDIRLEAVTPQKWTKALGVGSDKGAHRAAARNLFGGNLFDRVKDDGRADAALIGHYWLTSRQEVAA